MLTEQRIAKPEAPAMPRGDRNENPVGIGFKELLAEDFVTHGSNIFEQGFWALAVHRFGNWRMGFRWKVIRAPLTVTYHILYKIVEWTCGITLPYTTKVGRRVRLWHHSGMILVARSIGNECQIRQNTTFGVAHSGRNNDKPVIEDRVDLGAGVCALGNIRIGHDCLIGANAVVTTDIPPYSVAVGIPARVIKSLRPIDPKAHK